VEAVRGGLGLGTGALTDGDGRESGGSVQRRAAARQWADIALLLAGERRVLFLAHLGCLEGWVRCDDAALRALSCGRADLDVDRCDLPV